MIHPWITQGSPGSPSGRILAYYPLRVTIHRLDMAGRLDGARRTPQGGLRAPANLTRTGVLVYRNPDGSTSRELRPPDEVFNADSLESLRLAPVTVGHPGMVSPGNYTVHSKGVVSENVKESGCFVSGDILVQDAATVAQVERGALVELSCGYSVRLDTTPGEYQGERYDAVQRDIRYNHVGLGPAGWGRAGSEVALKLDGGAGESPLVCHYTADMTVKADDTEASKKLDQLTARMDALEARNKVLEEENAKLKAEAEKREKTDQSDRSQKQIEDLLDARLQLQDSARAVLGHAFLFTKDSVDGKRVSLSESEVMVAAILVSDPSFKADGRSPEYLRGRFDFSVEQARKSSAAHGEVNANSGSPGGSPASGPLAKARTDQAEAAKKAAQGGSPAGAMTKG